MRKPGCILAIGLSAVIITLVGAQGDVRREIQAIYNRASSAAVAARTLADIDAIHGWLDTPDCVYTDAGRPARTWTEQRAFAAADLRTPLKSLSNQIEKLEIDGTRHIATTIVKGVARISDGDGRFGTRGADHDVETTATVRDVWVRTSDGWQRQSHTKILANRITAVDGKPISP
jgi:hypothetical protein